MKYKVDESISLWNTMLMKLQVGEMHNWNMKLTKTKLMKKQTMKCQSDGAQSQWYAELMIYQVNKTPALWNYKLMKY